VNSASESVYQGCLLG